MPDPDDPPQFDVDTEWLARQAEREEAFLEAVADAEEETPLPLPEYHILGQSVDDVGVYQPPPIPEHRLDGGLLIGEIRGNEPLQPGAISFAVASTEVLRFDPDGKAYVQGKFVDQPEDIIHALRWFMWHLERNPRPLDFTPNVESLRPESIKVPRYMLGQKLRCPSGREGTVVAIFHGFASWITPSMWDMLEGERYDDNQVFYGLRTEEGRRIVVGEHAVTPIVPLSADEPIINRVSLWERLLKT